MYLVNYFFTGVVLRAPLPATFLFRGGLLAPVLTKLLLINYLVNLICLPCLHTPVNGAIPSGYPAGFAVPIRSPLLSVLAQRGEMLQITRITVNTLY